MAEPTAERTGKEEPNKVVRLPAARPNLPSSAPASAVEPTFLGKPETGKQSAGLSPNTHSLGLEVPGFAQERPSCGGDPSTLLVLAGGREKEAASRV